MRDELDLRLVDVAAFHASQSPVLIAPTHDDAALMILRRGLTLRSRNNLDQNYKLSPQRFIFDGGVGAQQSEAENAVDDEQAADVWFLAVTIVEKRYVDAELLSDFLELRRADPAEALFVFLHLMKDEAEVTGQLWLANRICARRRDAGVKLTVRPVAPRDEMGTPHKLARDQ
jgi:hypothetical protein